MLKFTCYLYCTIFLSLVQCRTCLHSTQFNICIAKTDDEAQSSILNHIHELKVKAIITFY